MINSAEEFCRLRMSEDPDEYRVAAWGEATVEVWMDIIRRFPEMREWVAHNKTIPDEIIRHLAFDADRAVRHMIASKNRTPVDILEMLSKDSDEGVRMRVACHKRTPIDLLKAMRNDPWCEIAKYVKARLND